MDGQPSAAASARDRLKRGEAYFLALDLIAALEEVCDAAEGIAVYPEGTVGLEDLAEARTRARRLLDG